MGVISVITKKLCARVFKKPYVMLWQTKGNHNDSLKWLWLRLRTTEQYLLLMYYGPQGSEVRGQGSEVKHIEQQSLYCFSMFIILCAGDVSVNIDGLCFMAQLPKQSLVINLLIKLCSYVFSLSLSFPEWWFAFVFLAFLFIYLFVCVCVYELCGKNICVYWVHFSVLFYWFCNMCRYTF